ncbi:MAG: CRISPR-associated endonuclease Cas2, partial [Methylobacteriaceae bacterium]|nr:CRISPR-associated endonuclease Cas2 [Methylobacteriaceae bacterium]
MATFVIGYDIRNPRRLQRVHKAMLNHATPIEYSVFVLEGNRRAAEKCMLHACRLINPKEDDLRCYRLPARGIQIRLGKPSLPEGIIWTGLPCRDII